MHTYIHIYAHAFHSTAIYIHHTFIIKHQLYITIHDCNPIESIYMQAKIWPQPLLVNILTVWIYCPECPQVTTYKLDFKQERSDREKAMRRFVRERRDFQLHIAELKKRLKAMHLEHENSLAQLQQLKEHSLPHGNEVGFIYDQVASATSLCV